MNWSKIFFIILISVFVLYIVWHLGRFYGQTEDQKQFYHRGTITEDAYNYYLLTKCLKGELVINK